MKKKVLIFSLAYYPSFVSGAEAAVREVTDRIDDIEFHLITLLFDMKAPRRERIGNVEVHRVGFGGAYLSKVLFIPLAVLKAAALHRKEKFDLMWSLMTYMLFPAVLAKMVGVSVPHVLTLQDGDPYEKVFERWFIKPIAPLLNQGFKTAASIHAISKHLASWPARRGYKGDVVIVHNGANPRDLKEMVDEGDVKRVQEQFHKKEGDVWLVNTARLVHQKANDDTIRALATLPPQVKLLLVGGGSDEVMLKDLVKELNLTDRVFFTGMVDRSEVSNYRKASDIFVAPSRSEGLGNAFLSAMASRLPVVATQEGGLAEFIFGEGDDEAQTAWVVEKDNPESIRHAVLQIMENPDQVKTVTERARAMVLEKYDWDKIAVKMREEFFKKVLEV